MKYLLDTNVWIAMIRGKYPEVLAHYQSIALSDLFACSVVVGELRTGAGKAVNAAQAHLMVDKFLGKVVSLPFDDAVVPTYARVRTYLESIGRPIGPLDTQIAAIALANDCTLVTHDVGEFSRVPGLTVVDWQAP